MGAAACLSLAFSVPLPAAAQQRIIPNRDGTRTIVDRNGNRINILNAGAGTGNISLKGTGYGETFNVARGVELRNNAQILTTEGNITLTGTGRNITLDINSSLSEQQGILVDNSLLRSTTGTITLTGTGGDITVTERGNFASINGAFGIVFNNSTIESTQTGDINLTGTGSNITINSDFASINGSQQGIVIRNANNSNNSIVRSTTGTIALTGAGTNINRTTVNSNSASISANQQQEISFKGISLENFSVIESTQTGNISLTGTGANIPASVVINPNVSLKFEEIILQNASINPSSTNSGTVTLTADEINILDNSQIGGNGGTLQLQPLTPSLDITVGGTTGTTDPNDTRLNLDETELNTIQNGFSNIIIGGDSSGNITVVNDTIFNDPVTLRSPSGNITVDGVITGADDGSIALNGSGQTILNANIITPDNSITIDNNVIVENNITLNGNNVTFGGTVDSNRTNAISITINSKYFKEDRDRNC